MFKPFKPFSSVSIVDFAQVNNRWVIPYCDSQIISASG